MKKILYISFVMMGLSLISCDKFLSERPSSSSERVPETVDDVKAILAGMWREDVTSSYLLFSSDDAYLYSDIEKAKSNTYAIEEVLAATWDRESIAKDYSDQFWLYRYQNIFRANLAFLLIPDVDATDNIKQELMAKASFRRALSYMELANIYALPYSDKNLNEPGLVLKDNTSYDTSLKRATIKDTYKFIEKDILEALNIKAELSEQFGENSHFRVTKAAVNALAARFYLSMHNYSEALKYAKLALDKKGPEALYDYNTIGYARTENNKIEIDGESVNYVYNVSGFMDNYAQWDNWTEDYFRGIMDNGYGGEYITWGYPSPELIGCYETDIENKDMDARWKYMFNEHKSYYSGIPVDYPGYSKGANYYQLWYNMSVPEIMLIVAECEARVGDYSKAMEMVNTLRLKRINPSSKNLTLVAANKQEAISIVIRERRRELPIAMRWYDLRRYNHNNDSSDDVVITRKFYSFNKNTVDLNSAVKEYVLKPGDRRYAAPIPESDIIAGDGELEQNKY